MPECRICVRGASEGGFLVTDNPKNRERLLPDLESLLRYIKGVDPSALEHEIIYQNMPEFRETAIVEGYRQTLLRAYVKAKEEEVKNSYAQTA